MPIWNPETEQMARDDLRALQAERLKATVKRVIDNVPFYREKFAEAGVTADDIRSIDDIVKLPFTLKQDLRDNYPYGLFAAPMDEVVRIHASSGTTGKQTVVGYTEHDIQIWADCCARAIAAAGGGTRTKVHVSYGYGLFTGGLGLHYGAERMRATAIPVSSGNTARQIQILRDFGSNILCCTPSYALYIAEVMEEQGVKASDLALTAGIFGAEPWTEEMRAEIERRLEIKAYDIYGLSEITGPGVAFECECQSGMHVCEDHFYPEIIDPETGEPLPDGTMGELVFTCITKEALPLIRYRTRDIASLRRETCACGRTFVRMSKPSGRTDDMLIIRGVNVFPSQIESVLLSMHLTSPHYQLVVDRVANLDTLEVLVELSEDLFSDTVRGIEETEGKLRAAIESTLGVAVKVRLVEPKAIARSEGKAVRVIDRRKKN